MAVEIERKFLLKNDQWRALVSRKMAISQGYLTEFDENSKSSVRIRLQDNKANINVKSATLGISRSEYEYEVPVDEAREMLDTLCVRPVIDKTRYIVELDGLVWEIDEFYGENEGLLVAEVELDSAAQAIELPNWIGEEVSEDSRYYNVSLLRHPFSMWS